jgi:hypothetical protein
MRSIQRGAPRPAIVRSWWVCVVAADAASHNPRTRRHLAETLREDRQGAGRDVAVVAEVTVSPISWRASVEAEGGGTMTGRRAYTRCAPGATPATDSATDPGNEEQPALGCTRARDPRLLG